MGGFRLELPADLVAEITLSFEILRTWIVNLRFEIRGYFLIRDPLLDATLLTNLAISRDV